MKIDLPYLMPDDTGGRRRYYVRRYKRKIRLLEQPGTPAFLEEYRAAVEQLSAGVKPRAAGPAPAKRGTLGWLAAEYFASAEFKQLALKSQSDRRSVIDSCLLEPYSPSTPNKLMRDCPLAHFSSQHVKVLRDRKAGPAAGNNRKKYISAMFGWGVEAGKAATNPAREVRRRKYASSGYHTWTVEEVAQFVKRHPRGTKAHLAVGLLLFLGARPSDTAKFGRQHVRQGSLHFVPAKTRHLRTDVSAKPILPILQAIIDASPTGDLTFLVTEHGKPFSDKGFGNKMRQWCDEAGLPQCTAHGLRKAGATILANNGATVHQLMALYDWSTTKQAEAYTRAANRAKLTGDVIPLLAKGME